jgi:hypothetical protein
MRALVVYESMYGNTHAVATSIAAGLEATHDVTLVPVTRATPELVASAGLIVAGGPTHMHRMSTVVSRRMAAQSARMPGSELKMDPDADGPGLRVWLSQLSGASVLAASFDTRLGGMPALTGRASHGIARLLAKAGCVLLVPPESFLVDGENLLVEGELTRARSWGALVGETERAVAVTVAR